MAHHVVHLSPRMTMHLEGRCSAKSWGLVAAFEDDDDDDDDDGYYHDL